MTAPFVDVLHDATNHRFLAELEGQRAVLEYAFQGESMVITHTGVPQAIGGRGIAALLNRAAMEFARSQDRKVIPACTYTAAFLQRHAEYRDLLA